MMHNEPRVVPVSPGQVLVRLSEIIGAARHASSNVFPDGTNLLETARQTLLDAVESGDREARIIAFEAAQNALMQTHDAVLKAESVEENLKLLGFPSASSAIGEVQKVDVSSVLATFAQPQKQVFMTLSFDDAPGAIAYWLRETRVIGEEEVHDDLIENFAPVFQRVRLAPGAHRLRIESRNLHQIALSDEFTIVIPAQE